MSDDLVTAAVCGISFLVALGGGYYAAACHYDEKIAEMEQARLEAVAGAEKKNAEGLAKAADTINLAQAEYNDLRSELDRARARLRHANSSSGADASAESLRKRVAALEELVSKLADAGSECGAGWQRSASRHDALAEAVK